MSTAAQLEKMINWNSNRSASYARGYRAAMLAAAKLCRAESERVRAEDVGKMQPSHSTRARGEPRAESGR